jgi:hypothetical protein
MIAFLLNQIKYRLLSLPQFRKSAKIFRSMLPSDIAMEEFPILCDMTSNTSFDRDYMYHPAWAARIIAKTNPKKHVDISSTLIFSALVSAFVPVDFYDFRPADIKLSNLNSGKADLTKLDFKDNSIRSLSCLSTIEHIGLGRYGDPLDPDGDKKAMSELSRVLAKGGNLLVAVPVGKPRVIFNAHRIYSYKQIIDGFKELDLVEFTVINSTGTDGLIVNPCDKNFDSSSYDCGCFWFTKRRSS